MKKILLSLLTAIVMTAGASAEGTVKINEGGIMKLSGTIIDNLCAKAHESGMEAFIKTHTKECALMPKCAASGYSLYHYGAAIRFDGAGSKKIEQFLKKKESTLNVVVEVKKSGNLYSLVSIKNR
ncbi:MAG: hypothetical protein KA369_13765 [Spirochaetes bacterium]|nr:hypothetical protein [Spirochaetota bacterium]